MVPNELEQHERMDMFHFVAESKQRLPDIGHTRSNTYIVESNLSTSEQVAPKPKNDSNSNMSSPFDGASSQPHPTDLENTLTTSVRLYAESRWTPWLFRDSPSLNNIEPPISQLPRANGGDRPELSQTGDHRSDVPRYQHVRMLGHGGSGVVEMVRDVSTGSVYARKIIKNVYSRNMEEAKQKLLNEVRIMQRLASHHHIVSVHATYIKKRELAIILDPVADGGDLTNFLQNYRDRGFSWLGGSTNDANLFQNGILRKSFGCLASALTFIHKQNIRHKDIKPQNILIHQGSIMYTDFGVSYDFKDNGRSTTTGDPGGISKRYCAPEVADCGSRNTKSDVFSL
jgi:hypothetical protein